MRKILTIIILVLFVTSMKAQAPQKMSYQAVIRNASNALVANANVRMRISVLQGTATGTAVYVETQTATTNTNGLVTLEIGAGTVVTGTFASIAWGTNAYFIKTETDPTGGTNYSIVGTSQFLSVPYALFASNSASSTNNWTASGIHIANNNVGNVGIGTGTDNPTAKLTVRNDNIGFSQENTLGTTKIGFYTSNSGAWLQTHSNTDLSFATSDGATQMTLQKATGNLGIGVDVPGEKLEVAGKTKTTNLQVTNGAGAGKVLTSDAIGNATWQSAGTNEWSVTGNSGTNPANNFIGTTDNNDLVFKRFNLPAGRISAANTSFGAGALDTASTGLYNSAVGTSAMSINTTGGFNTAMGYYSLKNNTTGGSNSATGYGALDSNTSGNNNTANGAGALSENTIGSNNAALGVNALANNITGSENTAVGTSALVGSSTAFRNTAVGKSALSGLVSGDDNTALGINALNGNGFGFKNTAIGANSGSTITGNNNIVLGYDAEVPSGAGSNQLRIGNTDITYAGVQTAWTITSDRRWKDNIQQSPLGLDFISKLNPVAYTRKNDDKKKIEFGFIAQELESALNASDAKNNGIITIGDDGMYGVRYNDLISISVKAIQDQQEIINSQKDKIRSLEDRLKAIEEKLK